MAGLHANFIECTTGTEGISDITLVRKTGYPLPLDIYSANDTFEYTIKNGNNWETGLGTVNAANVLVRTTPYATWIDATTTYDDSSPSPLDLSGTSSVGVVNTGQNIDAPTVDSLTVNSGGKINLPITNDATNPTINFNGVDGFYLKSLANLSLSLNSIVRYEFSTVRIQSVITGGFYLKQAIGSATVPSHSFRSDIDTGHGRAAADADSHIAGGIEYLRGTEVSSHVIVTWQGNYGLTAHTGSSQGDGPILSSNNEYSTVGTTGDAATLPTATAGKEIKVMNNGANSMDIFPDTGDDIDSAGANVAYSLAAGGRAIFHASDATNWNVF